MKITKYIRHCLLTATGLHQYKYCDKWDEVLNEIIDSGEVIFVGWCTIKFEFKGRSYEVFSVNGYPSFATIFKFDNTRVGSLLKRRPKFKTMLKLELFVDELNH